MRIICGEASIYTHFEDFVVADLISAYNLNFSRVLALG